MLARAGLRSHSAFFFTAFGVSACSLAALVGLILALMILVLTPFLFLLLAFGLQLSHRLAYFSWCDSDFVVLVKALAAV